MTRLIRTTFQTYAGYLILVAWFATLVGLGYAAHVVSQDARNELFSQLLPDQAPTVQTTASETVTSIGPDDATALGPEWRARLSTGLDTLTDILKNFQAKTASAAFGPE